MATRDVCTGEEFVSGAYDVMDRGYLDFARLYKMHQSRAFFVTRAKNDMSARRVYSAKADRRIGIGRIRNSVK